MPGKAPLALIISAIALICGFSIATPAFAQHTDAVIYSFCDNSGACPDGAFPYAGLTFDASGNLYGTTYEGGGGMGCNGSGCGSVFRLKPTAASTEGTWTETILHGFPSFSYDGFFPYAGVTLDHAGNIYGTTWGGGIASSDCNIYGCGTVFELTPNANDEWSETLLYDFCSAANCKDGDGPVGGLIFDAAGNLYGTTATGGNTGGQCPYGCGAVFELSPGANGIWTEKVLFRFLYAEGANPQATLVFDSAGNLYGTTSQGGTYGIGAVFELTPHANGAWTETTLYNFNTTDGRVPLSSLIFDAAGNLYGTTFLGGTGASCAYSYGCGTVFELSPGSNGSWTEQVLYNFCSAEDCTDGLDPWGSLVMSSKGVLYGTTNLGGAYNGGVLFQLTLNTTWNETLLYNFGTINYDALNSQGSLVLDARGNLYGTGENGGSSTNCNNFQGCGAVFMFNPHENAQPGISRSPHSAP
jgi:uncharacterized repeat protein (TIGR03803 family)